MGNLSKLSAANWSSLCSAAGWTVYGAVALSWCKDAKLEDVWAGWLTSGFPLKPLPEHERPARFLNPALLPEVKTAEGINQWVLDQGYADAETYRLATCAVIAALNEPLEFHLPPEKYANAAPQVAAFLKSRLLRKADRSPEDDAIIETLSRTIRGTQWDIWSEEAA